MSSGLYCLRHQIKGFSVSSFYNFDWLGRYFTTKLLYAVEKQAEETNGCWVYRSTVVVSLYTLTESESISIETK